MVYSNKVAIQIHKNPNKRKRICEPVRDVRFAHIIPSAIVVPDENLRRRERDSGVATAAIRTLSKTSQVSSLQSTTSSRSGLK